MTLHEWLTLSLTVIGAISGAGWALLNYYFRIQKELADLRLKNVTEGVGRVEHSFDKLANKLDEVEKASALKIAQLWEKFHVLSLEMIQNANEIKETRNSMGEISKTFSDRMEKMANKLQEVYIGEGRYRITGKK